MFRIKRPAIIGLLVVLLVFTGYLNHELTQQGQLKTSKEYQKHEISKLNEMDNDDDNNLAVVTNNKDIEDSDINLVDSKESEKIEADALEAMASESNMGSKNYFVEYRLSRDKLRGTLVERLDGIVKDENTNENSREEAQKEIIRIGRNSEKELQIEGLVKAKGYEDALVFLTNDDIKIVVSSTEIGEQDMVKILEIVKSETEYTMDNIKIMKKQ